MRAAAVVAVVVEVAVVGAVLGSVMAMYTMGRKDNLMSEKTKITWIIAEIYTRRMT